MAIDSALKRRSVGGVPFLPLGPNVTPNASKPAAWRASAAWSYAGILPTPPSATLVRRPNMMRTGSRGDWIFNTVN